MERIRLILEVLNTLAIMTGAVIAVRGLNAWKSQLKGKTDYELARRYLKSAYRLRDALRFVRNPFISSDEIFIALKDSGLSEAAYNDRQQADRAVYSKRWKMVVDAISDFEVELRESEVSWGKEAVLISTDLNNLRKQLFVTIKLFLENVGVPVDRGVLYETSEDDDFNRKLDAAVKKIEAYLSPHLK